MYCIHVWTSAECILQVTVSYCQIIFIDGHVYDWYTAAALHYVVRQLENCCCRLSTFTSVCFWPAGHQSGTPLLCKQLCCFMRFCTHCYWKIGFIICIERFCLIYWILSHLILFCIRCWTQYIVISYSALIIMQFSHCRFTADFHVIRCNNLSWLSFLLNVYDKLLHLMTWKSAVNHAEILK